MLAEKKLITLEKAIEISRNSRGNQNTIGLTNGGFDIIHSGHCKLFEFSKKYCNILLVGVNIDSIIKKLKGSNRPINDMQERIKVLTYNKDIDYVFHFDFENAYEIVKAIVPDIYIQGKEYEGKLTREEALCRVLYLEKDDKSTTSTMRKIRHDNRR